MRLCRGFRDRHSAVGWDVTLVAATPLVSHGRHGRLMPVPAHSRHVQVPSPQGGHWFDIEFGIPDRARPGCAMGCCERAGRTASGM